MPSLLNVMTIHVYHAPSKTLTLAPVFTSKAIDGLKHALFRKPGVVLSYSRPKELHQRFGRFHFPHFIVGPDAISTIRIVAEPRPSHDVNGGACAKRTRRSYGEYLVIQVAPKASRYMIHCFGLLNLTTSELRRNARVECGTLCCSNLRETCNRTQQDPRGGAFGFAYPREAEVRPSSSIESPRTNPPE